MTRVLGASWSRAHVRSSPPLLDPRCFGPVRPTPVRSHPSKTVKAMLVIHPPSAIESTSSDFSHFQSHNLRHAWLSSTFLLVFMLSFLQSETVIIYYRICKILSENHEKKEVLTKCRRIEEWMVLCSPNGCLRE